jgi:methylmalonyl-CoA mutase cobalamin-binding domain/chain
LERSLIYRAKISWMEILEKIAQTIVELRFGVIKELCREALGHGYEPMEVVDAMRKGMEEVGKRYERGEYFLPELIAAGEIAKEGMEVLQPHLEQGERRSVKAKLVIGTVQGDIHDIGKNIFAMLARAAGFEVVDLGVDVPPERFLEAVKKEGAQVLGLSCLITPALPAMRKTVELLEKEGLRGRVKVILGGAPLTEELGRKLGADAAVNDAVKGVEILKSWFQ